MNALHEPADAGAIDTSVRMRDGNPHGIVLFDLDGTLVDSAPDLADAVNLVLQGERRDPLDAGEVRTMIGNGVRELVRRAFAARNVALENDGLTAMTNRMMAVYGERLTRKTALMPGATAAIDALTAAGWRIGLVTNKPHDMARRILHRFDLLSRFDAVVGSDGRLARKPAPDMIAHARMVARCTDWTAIMVGDGPADAEAAHAAGVACVLVRGGYSTVPIERLGADRIIETLDDLAAAVAALAARDEPAP